MISEDKKGLVIVDFDETLVMENTLLPLYKLSMSPSLVQVTVAVIFSGRWRKVGLHKAIKEKMYRHLLQGRTRKELLVLTEQLAPMVSLNPTVWGQVKKLMDDGGVVIVATASLDVVVQKLLKIKRIAVDGVVGTIAEFDDTGNHYSGRLVNGECEGRKKAKCVSDLINLNYKDCYVYGFGNLPADREMLQQVSEGYVVTGGNLSPFY